MQATQRLYRTVDGEVVGEGDPRAAFLIAGVGDEVPAEYADKASALGGPEPVGEAAEDDEPEDDADDGASDEPEDDAEKAEPAPPDKAEPKAPNKSTRRPNKRSASK